MMIINDKEIRGRILKTLNNQYPNAISKKMLVYGLKAARYECNNNKLQSHLFYLQEKGYVQMENVGIPELDLERDMIRLTVLGKDLVEGSINADPGVILL